MTAGPEQQPVNQLAALFGHIDWHGEALNDPALFGFAAMTGDMRPSNEVDEFALDLGFHAADQGFRDDNRFGQRSRFLNVPGHVAPSRVAFSREVYTATYRSISSNFSD